MVRPRHWPRSLLALLVAGGSAALGVSVGTLAAAAAPRICGQVLGTCPPPTGTAGISTPSSSPLGPPVIQTRWTGVATDGHIASVSVTLTWTSTGGPDGVPMPSQPASTFTAVCTTHPDSGGSQECDAAWPPEVESLNGYVLNGQYTVSATATTSPDTANPLVSPSNPATTPLAAVSVANRPAPPANVSAKLVTAPTAGVAVTWDPSPEPDVFAYEVLRVAGSQTTTVYGCYQPFAPKELRGLAQCQAKPSWVDTQSGGGQFSYQVVAVRFGATYDVKAQVASDPAQTKGTVTVAGPPAAPGIGAGPGKAAANYSIGLGKLFSPVKPRVGASGGIPTGAAGAPATTDPGFNPTLPYNQQPAATDPPTVAVAAPPAAKGHGSSVGSIALVGAGLLVIAIALHGLWLRSEVRRAGVLETLEPE